MSAHEIDGHKRLPVDVRPLRYALTLDLDPTSDRFRGEVNITLRFEASVDRIRLHADQLRIEEATFERDGHVSAVPFHEGENGGLEYLIPTAEGPTAEGPGEASLRLVYSGPLTEVPEGVYRVREADAWYIFTQFEPISARRCFPCFDEPGFKAEYEIKVRTPKGLIALSNSPIARVEHLLEHDVHAFYATPPLASYLVAFAVGPFDVVDAGNTEDGVPLRIITTIGRSHLARFAVEETPAILAELTRWFGMPYPYAKLDLVGVPNFAAGAMENVGLVTFRERLLLLDVDHAPAHDRLWAKVVIAHELAHMWFGNLVTMPWWDDLWLNEAFATWMETACVHAIDPSLDIAYEAVLDSLRVMDHDALKEARAIRQPIRDGGDVLNAFDGITYSKGAAVVRMTEAWLGSDVFRLGVQRYLTAFEHGNAVTQDLIDALETASGKDVDVTLRTFLDQPGVPIISVTPIDGGGHARVQQWRYLPNTRPAEPDGRWRIPLTIRYGDSSGETGRVSHLLTSADEVISLPGGAAATWLHPNASEAAYCHWQLPKASLAMLAGPARIHLDLSEKIALVEHVWALLESGEIPAVDAFEATLSLAAEPHRMVLGAVAGVLRRMARLVVGPLETPALALRLNTAFAPHLSRLGHFPKTGESPADRLLRPVLIGLLADVGACPSVNAELSTWARVALRSIKDADVEVLQYALPIAAWDGDEALLDELVKALDDVPTPAHATAFLTALGSFPGPILGVRALDVFLTDRVRAQDVFTLLRPSQRRPATFQTMWTWLDRHFEVIAEKIGDEMTAHLPGLASGFSDVAGRLEAERLFADASRHKPGLDRNLRQALEDIDRRARLRACIEGPLRAHLGCDPRL